MIELLAVPGWQTGPTPLAEWIARLGERTGRPVSVERESPKGMWIEVAGPRLRGYALVSGPDVEAIDFELNDPDPVPATRLLEEVAASIGWEIHPDDGDGEAEDDDD